MVPEPLWVSDAAPARTSETTPFVRLIAPVTESVLLPVTVPPPRFRALMVSETLVRLSTPPFTVTVPLASAVAPLPTKVPELTMTPPVKLLPPVRVSVPDPEMSRVMLLTILPAKLKAFVVESVSVAAPALLVIVPDPLNPV